jgi:hypothetical protein
MIISSKCYFTQYHGFVKCLSIFQKMLKGILHNAAIGKPFFAYTTHPAIYAKPLHFVNSLEREIPFRRKGLQEGRDVCCRGGWRPSCGRTVDCRAKQFREAIFALDCFGVPRITMITSPQTGACPPRLCQKHSGTGDNVVEYRQEGRYGIHHRKKPQSDSITAGQ